MAYISLYRKYRPKKFADVIGQDVIIKILKNSISNNKIGHAYIFSGPRGTGKTSTAKIFAKAVNCKNPIDGDVCENCEICKINSENEIDIVEIDAASNNGIDEIREIKNSIKLLPAELKYKVYIVDEVHMLSNSAFNALLKTLEEPPAHAIFILATTEINKIPLTVLSRCQKFDFKKITKENIIDRLTYIIKEENIKNISDDILNLIAELSDGGLRDAINLLDQVNSLNKDTITQTDVLNLVGAINNDNIISFLNKIVDCNISEVIKTINDFYNKSINFINVVNSLENLIKDIIIFNNSSNYFDKEYEKTLFNFSKVDINKLLQASEYLFSLNNELKRNNQRVISEIYLLKVTLLFKKEDEIINNNKEVKEKLKKDENIDQLEVNKETIIEEKNDKSIIINNVFYGANKEEKEKFLNKFSNINEFLTDKKYNSIANLLIKSTPEVVSDKIVLFSFKNDFEVVLFDKNEDLVKKLLKNVYNKNYEVVAISTEDWKSEKNNYIKNIKSGVKYTYIEEEKKKKVTKKRTNELENTAELIFGDGIIVEDLYEYSSNDGAS